MPMSSGARMPWPTLMHMQQTTQADLFTVWPTQLTVTWGERLVVPLMAFAVLAYLPVYLVHHTPYALAAAANGQCMLFRTAAPIKLAAVNAAIPDRVLDDVLLTQRVKAARRAIADGRWRRVDRLSYVRFLTRSFTAMRKTS